MIWGSEISSFIFLITSIDFFSVEHNINGPLPTELEFLVCFETIDKECTRPNLCGAECSDIGCSGGGAPRCILFCMLNYSRADIIKVQRLDGD